MSLFGRTAPRHLPRPVNLLPTDIPRFESELIAADVLAAGPHPSMRDGKGVHDADSALVSNVVAMDTLRGKGRCQRCTSSNDVLNIRLRGQDEALRLCRECRPIGMLGVVGGGDVA